MEHTAATNATLLVMYGVYGTIAVGLVVWLAKTLSLNGALFLEDVFEHKPGMAEAVNRLLVIGFYMLNLGYALLLLPSGARPTGGGIDAAEFLITKLGVLLLSLGAIHFVNMYVFWRIRRRRQMEDAPLPFQPQSYLVDPETLVSERPTG
jgi:hypothetical protein